MACRQAARALVKNCYQVTKIGSLSEDDYLKKELRNKTIQVMTKVVDSTQTVNRKQTRSLLEQAGKGCYAIKSLLFALEDLGYLPPGMIAQLRDLVDDLLGRIEELDQQLHRQINLGFLFIQL